MKIKIPVPCFSLITLALAIFSPAVHAQKEGDIDTSFDPGGGANGTVEVAAVESDGKILVGGDFTQFNGVTSNYFVRLNADGSIDNSFETGSGASSIVYALSEQTNAQIMIGGGFGSVNGYSYSGIARVNADGSLDLGFDPGTGANGAIRDVKVQRDGKIVIGGSFTSFDGASMNLIARLNADGSLDGSFDPGSGFKGSNYTPVVSGLALQTDGKILVCGGFSYFNGVARGTPARLNTDGSLDTSFSSSDTNDSLFKLALQSDGKIVIVGKFTGINGVARNRVARLNTDGSLDTSFDPGAGPNDTVYALLIQDDNRVVIVGDFTTVDGVARNHVARLTANGSLDTTFDPGTGTNGNIDNIVADGGSKALVCGGFQNFNGVTCYGIARVYTSLAPIITSKAAAAATVGKAFSYQITATNKPTSYAVQGLPKSLKLDAKTGLISGTPTAAGKATLILKATNAHGTGTAQLTLTVKQPAPPAPEITSAGTATATVGQAFSYQITATNNPTAYAVANQQPGLSLNKTTGLISGTSTGPVGTYTLTLKAANAGGTGEKTLTLTIMGAPVITSAGTATATIGKAFSYQIVATNDPTNYAVVNQQPGLTLNHATGLISGKPTGKAGTYSLTLKAGNATGTGTKTLTLTIQSN